MPPEWYEAQRRARLKRAIQKVELEKSTVARKKPQELEEPRAWFPIPGMCGGFSYCLEGGGRDIRDSSGSRISTIDDVKKAIDGISGASLVAMWLFFVR